MSKLAFNKLIHPKNWFGAKYSLRRTLLLTVFAITLLPLLLIGSVAIIISTVNNRQSITSKLETVSLSKDQAIHRWAEDVEEQLSNPTVLDIASRTMYEFSQRPENAPRLITDYRHDMMGLPTVAENFKALSVLDADGIVKASTDLAEINKDYSQNLALQSAPAQLQQTTLYYDPKTGQPTMFMALDLSVGLDGAEGTLLGNINLQGLKEILGDTHGMGTDVKVYLATADQTILDANLIPQPGSQTSYGVMEGLSGSAGSGLYKNHAGTPVVGAYSWMEHLGAVLLTEQPQAAAFAGPTRVLLLFILLIVIVISFDIYLGFQLTNRIINPIQELTQAASVISADINQGDISQIVALKREDEIGTLAQAFHTMTTRLRELVNNLELKVQERTKALAQRGAQLQTATNIAKAANTILDTNSLINQTVTLIKEQFNYYYVGLFLIDPDNEWAVLRAGTGTAGQQQLENNHRLKIDDRSMIGWSIIHRQPRISDNVQFDAVRFKNPYLPETRSEMALPLISRETVLGAISIQSTAEKAFSEEDIIVLQTVADQIATALHNSQIFAHAQEVQARFEDLYHRTPAGYHTLALNGTILEINDTELAMLGYSGQRDNIVNLCRLTDFMTPDCKPAFERSFQDLLEGKKIENLELTFIRKDGSLLPVSMNASLEYDHNNQPLEIYASIQDISRQKDLLTKTETLYQLGQQLLKTENKQAIYQACINAIKTINPSRGIAILMYNQTGEQIEIQLSALWNNPAGEWPPVSLGMSFSDADLGLQDILLTGETITSVDGPSDPLFSPPLQQLLTFMQIRGLVGTPIWSQGSVIGFVLVGNHEPVPFSQEAIQFCQGVARQMSVSIDNLTYLHQALDRAVQMETAAEVAKTATSEIDLTVLLPKVISLIDHTFGYYHTSVFLVDSYKQFAVLQAASGEVGAKMLENGYKIPLDSPSQVSVAINQAKTKVTHDVRQTTAYLAHPLLPLTRSELTLPLIAQNQVIGALDVQSAAQGDFQSGEITVLQTIADQIANAINIARLFEKERDAAQEIQELHQRYLGQEWATYLQEEETRGKTNFILNPNNIDPVHTLAANLSNAYGPYQNESGSSYISPLSLRGTAIGSLGLIAGAEREWSEDDKAIIEAVSAQAALAIENARLIEETQRWATQLQIGTEISRVVTASLEVDTLIADSVKLIETQFQFGAVQLYHLNALAPAQPGKLYRSMRANQSLQQIETILPAKQSLTSQAMAQRKTLVGETPQLTLQKHAPPNLNNLKSILIIPLIVHQDVIGALEVYNTQTGAFAHDQITVLEILASQIAIAIENAQAYQEQQEISNQLREVDKLKTQFLANMSHELRTPLNSIIGFSRVILKGIDGPLTELQRADLTSIHQSGKHLLDLINNILDLAKIDAGKMELNFETVDLNNLIEGTSSTLKGLVKDKNIKIIKDIPSDLPPIQGDETRIRQIMLNLVSNAAKFTQEGSITIKADSTLSEVSLSVSDTGLGISADNLGAIFEEFTQVDASTTRKAGGTGLGLPITKKFIELHHGSIAVESELNVGSTFTVTLPITQPGKNGAALPVVPDTIIEPETVSQPTLLVVDNDPRVVEYYQQYLDGKGYKLLGLGNGMDTVAQAKSLQPYAILLDILLPDTSGWNVLEELKTNPYTAHIPVIICSIIEDKFRATKLGAADYLLKPIIKTDLIQALENLQEQKKHAKRVLVIDDRAEDILLIKRILEAHACQVIQAANGLDGLDIIFNNPPDLVILDLTMPELDGFGVLQSVRDNPKTAHIPTLIITARELTSNEEKTINRDADAWLRKGKFTDADLIQYVDKFLHRVAA